MRGHQGIWRRWGQYKLINTKNLQKINQLLNLEVL